MTEQYAVNVSFNAGNVGKAHNIFYFRYNLLGNPGDAAILATARVWIESIYAPLRPVMSNTFTHAGTRVDQVDDTGVIVRHVGTISPVVNGTAQADPNSGPTSMSGLARTAVPKVRGSKRFPGVTEVGVSGQLLTSLVLGALSQAVAAWLVVNPSPLSPYSAGVISSLMNDFVPFSNSGLVTNVPGTQVTRKPFRGA